MSDAGVPQADAPTPVIPQGGDTDPPAEAECRDPVAGSADGSEGSGAPPVMCPPRNFFDIEKVLLELEQSVLPVSDNPPAGREEAHHADPQHPAPLGDPAAFLDQILPELSERYHSGPSTLRFYEEPPSPAPSESGDSVATTGTTTSQEAVARLSRNSLALNAALMDQLQTILDMCEEMEGEIARKKAREAKLEEANHLLKDLYGSLATKHRANVRGRKAMQRKQRHNSDAAVGPVEDTIVSQKDEILDVQKQLFDLDRKLVDLDTSIVTLQQQLSRLNPDDPSLAQHAPAFTRAQAIFLESPATFASFASPPGPSDQPISWLNRRTLAAGKVRRGQAPVLDYRHPPSSSTNKSKGRVRFDDDRQSAKADGDADGPAITFPPLPSPPFATSTPTE